MESLQCIFLFALGAVCSLLTKASKAIKCSGVPMEQMIGFALQPLNPAIAKEIRHREVDKILEVSFKIIYTYSTIGPRDANLEK